MLTNLHVKNLALIEEVDVDFTNGLIVLTGETGAGKSLVLGSVNLALGQKASKEYIRTGSDYSLVELTFSVSKDIASRLKDMDVYMEDEGQVIVTRKISEQRSVAKINGESVNLKTLKAVMELLVDLHGQHDHQSLLYSNNHIKILDKFSSENDSLRDEVAEIFKRYRSIKDMLEKMEMDDGSRARELEFAKFEINEIEAANLQKGEDEELETQFKKMASSEQTVSTLSEVYNDLSDSGAGARIDHAISAINSLPDDDEKLSQFKQTLYDIDSLNRQLCGDISEFNSTLNFDPQHISEVESRLDLINKLKVKYGQTIDQIFAYRDEKQELVDRLENHDAQVEELTKELTECEKKLKTKSEELSGARKKAAKKLEKEIVQALNDLNFLSVEFEIAFEKKDYSSNGIDEVEFMISTNPGEPIKPLAKVASGGELSRIMLAIKSILASEDEIETLIFDEIDAGISGKTAQMVADKMAKIAENHQVICISHLAQIAAMADSHYAITKSADDSSTYTQVEKLDRDKSIEELVRISGSSDNSEAALANATELKDSADERKQKIKA